MKVFIFLLATLILVIAGCSSSQGRSESMVLDNDPNPPAETHDEMRDRILAAHNTWRQKVDVPPLVWSEDLASFAGEWAGELKDRGCDLQHRAENDYGENLAWAGGAQLSPEKVVDLWGEERADYNYRRNSCARGKVCGHYTQVVWNTSETVGCAVARCSDSEVWVCNYDPPGNIVGEKPY